MLLERLLMFGLCIGSIGFTVLGIHISNILQAKKKKRMDDYNGK